MKQVHFAAAMSVAIALPAPAWAQEGVLPPPRSDGPVTYVTGGIGQDEAQAMKAARSEYPLTLLFTEGPRGQYVADVRVNVKDKAGRTVLNVLADGPMMLVRLPPGDYRVSAEYNGRELQRAARVEGTRGTQVSLHWPSS